MKTVGVIQARMGSTRLPGKVLADIAGQPMLARVIERAREIPGITEVVVATSRLAADDAIDEMCRARGWSVVRGSETDVLERYVAAAAATSAELVVRITADCPLLDPEVGGQVVGAMRRRADQLDYVSNTITRSFPRGLDIEAMRRDALERVHRDATDAASREHVTSFIAQHPERFRIEQVVDVVDRSRLRWTVDTAEDLAFVRAVYAALGDRFGYLDAVGLCENRPELVAINAGVAQRVP